MELARRYLGPPKRGLEIGGASMNVFEGVDAWNLDYPAGDVFQLAQQVRTGEVLPIHVFGVGDRLPFADASLDFVLSSHVVEHLPDTIRALLEWSRVVVDGGVVFTIAPHRERTFDIARPRTELEHHLADYALCADAASNPLAPTSHYHVWHTEDLVALIERLNQCAALDWEILEVEDVDSKVGNGFTIVARKRSQPPMPRAADDAPVEFWMLTLDLPFQVVMRTTEYVVRGAVLGAGEGLPRGQYRAVPIHAGFPPRAGGARTIEVGDALPPPRIESVAIEGDQLRFEGRHFDATSYIEADFGGDDWVRALPELRRGGLEFPAGGIAFPDRPFAARVVTLPPGGGVSEPFEVDAHLR